MMNKLIPFSLLVVLLVTACRKREEPKPATVYNNQDIVPYSIFKTGTYWIYKDSTSGVEDSVYVYTDTAYSYYQTGAYQADGYYMFYNCIAKSYFDTYHYHYSISMGNYSLTTGQVGTVRVRNNPGGSIGETFLMSSCFEEGNMITWYLGDGTTYYKGLFDHYTVLGIPFSTVVKFYDSDNETEDNSRTNFYMAKNVGIIRKEIIDSNKVWNLIRYHIAS